MLSNHRMVNGRDRLQQWIERSKLNQKEAAEVIGIDPVSLSLILNGKREPGLANAVKIERVTGVTVDSWLQSEFSTVASSKPTMNGKPRNSKA